MKFLSLRLFSCLYLALIIFSNLSYAAEMTKTYGVAISPIAMGRESNLHLELNPQWDMSFALEAISISEGEELFRDEIQETNGDSLMTKGGEIALYVSRYTSQLSMQGFYWSAGMGYRDISAKWRRSPGQNYALKINNQSYFTDEDGKVTSELKSAGMTGHFRGGYRYVAESFPFMIGIYLGVRHFQGKFEDRSSNSSGSVSPASSEEKDALQRKFMSRLEPGLELGMAF